jgi:hypothetical protein
MIAGCRFGLSRQFFLPQGVAMESETYWLPWLFFIGRQDGWNTVFGARAQEKARRF